MYNKSHRIEPVYNYNNEIVAYKVINLLDAFTINLYNNYLQNIDLKNETENPPDNIVYNNDSYSYGVYSDTLGISLLNTFQPLVEKILKKTVLPSYTYSRIYSKNSELISHRDRPSCEISATVNLYQEHDKREPFYVSKKDKKDSSEEDITVINSDIGDAIIFFGQNDSDGYFHWRDPVNSEHIVQSFLHYVYADGQFTDNAYEWEKRK